MIPASQVPFDCLVCGSPGGSLRDPYCPPCMTKRARNMEARALAYSMSRAEMVAALAKGAVQRGNVYR